jgi:F-type H+-transporting ATPase subunit b
MSAGVLDEIQRSAIEDGLGKLVNHPVTCTYREDPSIIGGLRIRVGAWMLHANLKDELKSFVEVARARASYE